MTREGWSALALPLVYTEAKRLQDKSEHSIGSFLAELVDSTSVVERIQAAKATAPTLH
jgi:hypothetical protein